MVIIKEVVLAFANEALGKFIMTLAPAPSCRQSPTIPLTKAEMDFKKGEKIVNAVAERPLPRLGETGGSLGVVGPMKGDAAMIMTPIFGLKFLFFLLHAVCLGFYIYR